MNKAEHSACVATDASPPRAVADTARHSSCTASTDTARLISERAVSRHSTAVHEKGKQMNTHELVSRVEAGTPMTRADGERLVAVVFSAIADTLAKGETVPSPDSRPTLRRRAWQGKGAIRSPENGPPSRHQSRRRSRRKKRCATPSTSGSGTVPDYES